MKFDDQDSIAVTKRRDSYLEERSSDYSLESTETLDTETDTDDATDETEQIREQIEETLERSSK